MLPVMTYDRSTSGSDQTLRTVCRAEFARLVRQGGNRLGLILSAGFGLLTGLTALAILSYLSSGDADGATSLNIVVPMEVTIAVTAVLLSLSVVLHFGRRAQSGALLGALVLVPNRRRLLSSLVIATASLAAGAVFFASATVGITATVVSRSTKGMGDALVAAACGAIAAACLSVLALFLALITNRAVLGLMIWMLWWIVFPLALVVGGAFLPVWLSGFTSEVASATPTALLGKATTVSTVVTQGVGPLITGLAGLLAWVGVLGTLAYLMFIRRSV